MKEENKETQEMTVSNQGNYIMEGFDALGKQTKTKTNVYTNITDEKKLFNLENRVDNLLNDCEGETIRVKEILIKRYEKPLENPIFNEETGEIEKEADITMSCVLVDDNDKSYATGSKVFTIQLMRFLQQQSMMGKTGESFDIKIIRKKVGEKGNKALSFELV